MVLLVSDDVEVRGALQKLLLEGADRRYVLVESTTDATAVRDAFARAAQRFDCVVLDEDTAGGGVASPGLAADSPAFDVPVVVLTVASARERATSLLRLGAQEVISKRHLHAETLTRAVEVAVERFALSRLLQEREMRLRLAVEASDLGLWTWDVATDAVTWSPEVYRMLEVAEGSVSPTGTMFFGMIHPDDSQRVEAAVKAAARDRTLYRTEFRLRRPDGKQLWLENRGRALYDANGAPLRMLGTVADITERKRGEQALAYSEAFASKVVEASADCVAGLHADGQVIWMNAHGRAVLGLSESGAGPDFSQLWVDADEQQSARHAPSAAAAGNTGRFVGELKIAGQRRWFDVVITALPTSATAAQQLLCVARDITDARVADDERRRLQEMMQSVLDGSNALVFAKDLEGKYFLSNRAWRRFVGMSDERRVSDLDLFPHDVVAMLREHDFIALRSKAPVNFEESTVVGGRVVTYMVSKFPLLDDEGKPYAVCGVAIDVTQLKETQRALAQREVELQNLADNSPDIIARLDREGRHVFVSAAVERALGRSPVEVVGKTYRELGLPSELCDKWEAALDAAFAAKLPIELAFELDDEKESRSYTSRLIPELDDAGEVAFVLCIVRDRSLERRHELLLEESSRRKDEFLAILAHELRNPLAPLRTGLEILRDSPVRSERERAQLVMQRQVDHMIRLVEDLLDVSRISRGQIDLRREPIELRSVVEQAVDANRPLMSELRHSLSVLLPDSPVWLTGDLTRLAQVVGNLLNNAAKYTPEDGRIELRASVEGNDVRIRVADDGVGLSPDMLVVVFDMFTQSERSLSRAQGGLGIGLALVRNLVSLHGGSVRAESPGPGLGSTFTVTLPVGAPPASAEAGAGGVRQASHPRRILVVDDNVDGAEMLVMMLGLSGHETRAVYSGAEALAAATATRPDVIFLDIGLPDVSGYEVASDLRGQPELARTILVALTGWGAQEDKLRARAAGFDYHLTKPVDFDAVNDILKTCGFQTSA